MLMQMAQKLNAASPAQPQASQQSAFSFASKPQQSLFGGGASTTAVGPSAFNFASPSTGGGLFGSNPPTTPAANKPTSLFSTPFMGANAAGTLFGATK